MKKNILSVLAMLLALLCLVVACDNGSSPDSTESDKDWWIGTWQSEEFSSEIFSGYELFELNSDFTYVSYFKKSTDDGKKYIPGKSESGEIYLSPTESGFTYEEPWVAHASTEETTSECELEIYFSSNPWVPHLHLPSGLIRKLDETKKEITTASYDSNGLDELKTYHKVK